MAITIHDIARYCGVSKSTVSRVLNESDHVSDPIRKKVVEGMRVLNYRPNGFARGLSLKRSNTIAVVVQDIRNPFYSFASWYAERYLHQSGYRMFICNANNDVALEDEIFQSIKYHRVDGVLNVGGTRDLTNLVNFHLREDIPLVLVDRETHGYQIPAVNLDNHRGGVLAANYLLDRGHRSIVLLTSDFYGTELRRREGFIEALGRRGLPIGEGMVVVQSEEMWNQGICPALSSLIEAGRIPSAIFATNDYKAVQTMRILGRHGLSVPRDVSVIGYDDIFIASAVVPALTSIRQPLGEMIETSLELLLAIVGRKDLRVENKVFQPELVERESIRSVGLAPQADAR